MNVLCLVQNRTGIIDWSSLPMQCGGYETLGFDPDPAMHLDSEPDIKLSYTFTLQDLGDTINSNPYSNLSTFRFNFQDGTCMPANYYIFLLQKPPNKIRLRIRNRKTSLDTDFSTRKHTRHIGYTLNQYGLINK